MLLVVFGIGFTSCTKEDVIVDETENPVVEVESGVVNPLIDNLASLSSGSDEGVELACFVIDFPFSLDIDGEITEVTTEEELATALESLTEQSFVDFVYPLDVTYDDGTEESIADGEALGEAFASCIPDDGWTVDTTTVSEDAFPAFLFTAEEGCFDLVYPVTLTGLDGDVYTADSEEDFIELLADATDILFFDFPITIVGEDGEQVIESGEELFEAFASCWEDGTGYDTTWTYGGDIGCYGVEFPFSVVLANGNTVEVNNHDELCALMIEGTIAEFVYPLNLIDAEGNVIAVNSQEELDAALADCWGDGGVFAEPDLAYVILLTASNDGDGLGCFDIVYPINLLDTEGNTIAVNSHEELAELSFTEMVTVEYPFSIIPNTTEVTTVISSLEDLEAVLFDCE